MEIITVKGLKKSFKKVKAVKGIDFTVRSGQLFAFLGPNGAGKSTTIDILTTLTSFEEGDIRIDNLDLNKDNNKIKKIIGVVFQDNLLDEILTVRENLNIRASFYYNNKEDRKKAIEKACTETMCIKYIDRKYGLLSGGQKRRVDIARALLGKPKIMFLDEPTTGLDPQTRVQIWSTIKALQQNNGMTIFLTTHYMEEADVADYCTIIDEGKIVASGTPSELKEIYSNDKVLLKVSDDKKGNLIDYLKNEKIIFTENKHDIKINVLESFEALSILNKTKNYIDSFEVLHGTMDDVFLKITGKEIRE